MKKLMIAVAIVCAAAMSQAASLSWKVLTDATGETVYICSTGSNFESLADIIAAEYGTAGNIGTTATSGRAPATWTGAEGVATGIDDGDVGTQTFYAVVVDSSGKGYYAVAGSGEVYTTSSSPEVGLVDMAATIAGGNYTPWAGGPGPEPVPEPTSGLLMLVGLAGLALKRRRA